MNSNQALTLVLNNLRKKYAKAEILLKLTNTMQITLKENDTVKFGKILNERQLVMDEIDRLTAQNDQVIAQLPQSARDKLRSLILPDKMGISLDNPLETNIFDTNKRLILIMRKIYNLDTEVNKLAKIMTKK